MDPMDEPEQHQAATDGLLWDIVASTSTVVDTTLHPAHVTVLDPRRIVIVGDGRRIRIDADGVERRWVWQVRLALPMPSTVTADPDREATLAHWAGRAAPLWAREIVCSGETFAHSLRLADGDGSEVWLSRGSGHDVSA